MPAPKLTRASKQLLNAAIDDIFDKLKLRLLGPNVLPSGKRLFIGFSRDLSLPGMFEAAVREEGGKPDTEYLDRLVDITSNYIDKHRADAKAQLQKRVLDFLREVDTGKVSREDLESTVSEELNRIWEGVRYNIQRVVDTELQHAQTIGIKDGIDQVNAAAGVDDPVVAWICVHNGESLDAMVCEECRRLHTFRDTNGKLIPRAWKSSEVAAGYHKKGDPAPSWSGLHPHERCSLVTILPGFGWDPYAHIVWKGEGHDEWARQRGIESRYEARYGKVRKSEALAKSTPAGLELLQLLRPQYEQNKGPDLQSFHWVERVKDYENDRLMRWFERSKDPEVKHFIREQAVKMWNNNESWPAVQWALNHPTHQSLVDLRTEPPPEFLAALQKAPITMNFPSRAILGLLQDGRFRNLYETGNGMGNTDESERKGFERLALGIDNGVPSHMRPLYGALNFGDGRNPLHTHGGGTSQYGEHWAQLKPRVKERATFTPGDSAIYSDTSSVALPHQIEDLAARYMQGWSANHHAVKDFGAHQMQDREYPYIEAQIHGGVDLSQDVDSLHVNEFAAPMTRELMVSLGKKHQVPVYQHFYSRGDIQTLYHPGAELNKAEEPLDPGDPGKLRR